MSWRLAHSLEGLRAEVNERWPHRAKASDGTLGDAAHASRVSDHNPNAAGVVRAFDATAYADQPPGDNIDGDWLAEHIRQLGANGHPALQNHGYVIWNRRAAYATNGWRWKPYTGPSPHREHVHISVGRAPAQYDDRTAWGVAGVTPQPEPKPEPKPDPKPEEDDMAEALRGTPSKKVFAVDYGARTRWYLDTETLAELKVLSAVKILGANGTPREVSDEFLDKFRDIS